VGTLEPNKPADLIIVDRNPLEDIEALKRLRIVILDGKIAHRNEEY
jgi:imidazolonepropionase-like amidohydrolase